MKMLPVDVAEFIVLIGLAVGFRFWAASLARTPGIGKPNDQHLAETTVVVTREAPTKNWWESLPDQHRL
jgi:hypothetical protein